MDFEKIQTKWMKAWNEKKLFTAKNKGKKFFVMEMYPYPSGFGLHMGHARNYSIGDSIARFRRLQGYDVLYPMGWDAFGLPAENDAIEKGIHPDENIKQNIIVMKEQCDKLGISYDWSREVNTTDPEYYKWTQWLFLKLFENKLAYKKKSNANWCNKCKTVLANAQVENGKCWRCKSEVKQKDISQWFVKITDYADKLLDHSNLDWPKRTISAQKNWIGKSSGIDLIFKVKDTDDEIRTFTTRPDTYFGITFLVMAAEHPLLSKLIEGAKNQDELKKFIEDSKNITDLERMTKEKKGMFTGKYVTNPITGEDIELWVGNYVISSYGTGVVIAVPAHDQRDFKFAKEYNLRIKVVIQNKERSLDPQKMERAYVNEGTMANSEIFNNKKSSEAITLITDHLVDKGFAEKVTNYKLRDWCISRQRYWGAPIPIIYCKKCGTVGVPEKDLPVKLPLDVDFQRSKGEISPLETNEGFVNVKCPKCKGDAKREIETMDTFVDSSWYYLRYCDPKNKKEFADVKKLKTWMPVNLYIGGVEHTNTHLIYARFITKFLKELGGVWVDEPFTKLVHQGMVQKGGEKMSKSKGNIVDPLDVIKEHGTDTLRTYLLFIAQPDKDFEWSDKEMIGVKKFIDKVIELKKLTSKKKDKYAESVSQRKIKSVTTCLEQVELNRALIELMDFANKLIKHPSDYGYEILLQMFYPFAPHMCEELWSGKKMIAESKWPVVDEKKIDEKLEKQIESISKTFEDINHILKIVNKKPKNIYIYVIPSELDNYKSINKELEKEFGCTVKVFASNDKNIIDPDKKSKKAKPGKPGIYVE